MQAIQKEVYIPENHNLSSNIEDTNNILIKKRKRYLGLYKSKGSFKINENFKMTEDELSEL